MSIPIETIVRDRKTGSLGVTAPRFWPDLPDSVQVVYDGTDAYREVMPDELEVIGPYEAPIPNHEAAQRCGIGSGERTCVYLTMKEGGYSCARFSSIRYALVFKDDMVARAKPKHLFPACQDDIMAGVAIGQ